MFLKLNSATKKTYNSPLPFTDQMCQVQNQNIAGRYQAFSLAVTSNCQRSSREETDRSTWPEKPRATTKGWIWCGLNSASEKSRGTRVCLKKQDKQNYLYRAFYFLPEQEVLKIPKASLRSLNDFL